MVDCPNKYARIKKQCACACSTVSVLSTSDTGICMRNFTFGVSSYYRNSGNIPTYNTTGWYDVVQGTTCADFTACTCSGTLRLKDIGARGAPDHVNVMKDNCFQTITWRSDQPASGTVTGIPVSSQRRKYTEVKQCFEYAVVIPVATGGAAFDAGTNICYKLTPSISCESPNNCPIEDMVSDDSNTGSKTV